MASSLRDRNDQVLHNGDQILFRVGSSQANSRRKVVIVDDQGGSWLFDPRSGCLEEVKEERRRELSLRLYCPCPPEVADLPLLERAERALETLHLGRNWTPADLWGSVAAVLAAVGGSTTVSVLWQGSFDFLAPSICVFGASWLMHRGPLESGESSLSRRASLALSFRVALISASVLTLALAMIYQVYPEVRPDQEPSLRFAALSTIWLACVSLIGACFLLAGAVATWQRGGYPGESAPPKPK